MVDVEYFQDRGFTRTEFEYLCRIACWKNFDRRTDHKDHVVAPAAPSGAPSFLNEALGTAQAAKRRKIASTPPQSTATSGHSALSNTQRLELGRRCRILIDHARVEYLARQGFTAILVKYCDFHVTPDNTLILAVNNQLVHNNSS